ncbi:DUF1573 domain-containing protein [Tahibacter harae]|uniref:DUF1573 domain-containing protein n=1 Tax=Tahibacter harae TaxID=2963937 RepID=A0ABT1QXZ9_9GAMM|nr:DUF1573 domain-containing protein [Tahibacter harae]MCQ4167164.1 DUF1573 domain-containing protein [Tahibacter harae]
MASWKVWGVACLSLAGAMAANAAKLTTEEVNLGEIGTSRDVLVPVKLTNSSDKAVSIREIKPIFSLDRAVKFPATLAPGETATVDLDMDLSDGSGVFRRRLAVYLDLDSKPDMELVVSGYAWSPLTNLPGPLELGPIDLLEPLKTVRWEIPDMSESPLKIVGVPMKPDFLDTRITPDGRALDITPNASIPLSAIAERLVVRLGNVDGSTSDVSIRVSGTAFGRVAPNSDVVVLGLFESNKPQRSRVILTDRKNQRVKIGKVEHSAGIAKTSVSECMKKDKACKQLDFELALSSKTGNVNEDITVHVDGLDKPVIVRVTGLRAAPGTKVIDFNKAVKEAEEKREAGGGTSAVAANKPLFAQLRQSAQPPSVLEAEPGTGPLLKWQVEEEQQSYGYAVFRADAETGPFLRVSHPIIKRISAESQGANYAWRDKSAKAGQTYWYYVTTIYMDGRRERLSPILKKTVAAH